MNKDDDNYNPDKERPGYGISHPNYGAAHRNPYPGSLFDKQERSDEQIAKEITRKLEESGSFDASQISVKVASGEVTLDGKVESEEERSLADEIACQTPGVADCQNNLRLA